MKVTYTGTADRRIITSNDFPGMGEDFEDLVWTPETTLEVPDKVAKHLIEFSRHEFVPFDDPKGRDHRTKDELLSEASELDIEGRSKMNKEELLDAIYARREELKGSSGSTEAEASQTGARVVEPSDEALKDNDGQPYLTQEKADPTPDSTPGSTTTTQ